MFIPGPETSSWVIDAGAGTLFTIALLTTLAKLGIIQKREDKVDRETVEMLAKINGNLNMIVVVLKDLDSRGHRMNNRFNVILEAILNPDFRKDLKEAPRFDVFEPGKESEKKKETIQGILDKLSREKDPTH